uniref:Uncharacterized protein n=1 Tax=viral metagenome TaxID=1070528 RepID=A0A6C0KCF1_9ZZZZ
MLFYVALTVAGGITYLVARNINTIKETVEVYRGFKSTVDPDGKKGHFSTMCSFITLASIKFLLSIKNKKEKPVHETFNRSYIKISYTYKDKPYFYLLKIPKGVIPLSTIVDETGNDVESIITPYLGPNLDCHGITICPKDFGYEKLVITTVYDDVITFNETDVISF